MECLGPKTFQGCEVLALRGIFFSSASTVPMQRLRTRGDCPDCGTNDSPLVRPNLCIMGLFTARLTASMILAL